MPRQDFKVSPTRFGVIVDLKKRIKDPSAIVTKIGFLLAARAQQAFRDQKLGDLTWPARYPGLKPFIHIAGALEDFKSVSKVKANRFVKRPALRQTNTLFNSLTPGPKSVKSLGRNVIEVGTTIPYAGIHQAGGVSSQKITGGVRKNMSKFLRSAKGKKFSPVLGPIFQSDVKKTNINKRPFLGITDITERDIISLVQEEFKK